MALVLISVPVVCFTWFASVPPVSTTVYRWRRPALPEVFLILLERGGSGATGFVPSGRLQSESSVDMVVQSKCFIFGRSFASSSSLTA